jgi:hypothetical protein
MGTQKDVGWQKEWSVLVAFNKDSELSLKTTGYFGDTQRGRNDVQFDLVCLDK